MQADDSEVPKLMIARNRVDETGWCFSLSRVPSLKSHEGQGLGHVLFWACPGQQLFAKEPYSCGDKKSAGLPGKRNLQG